MGPWPSRWPGHYFLCTACGLTLAQAGDLRPTASGLAQPAHLLALAELGKFLSARTPGRPVRAQRCSGVGCSVRDGQIHQANCSDLPRASPCNPLTRSCQSRGPPRPGLRPPVSRAGRGPRLSRHAWHWPQVPPELYDRTEGAAPSPPRRRLSPPASAVTYRSTVSPPWPGHGLR